MIGTFPLVALCSRLIGLSNTYALIVLVKLLLALALTLIEELGEDLLIVCYGGVASRFRYPLLLVCGSLNLIPLGLIVPLE